MAQGTPTRLVICVDGTWCDPDGPALTNKSNRNITNVYRLCASVQKGECVDRNGKRFRQEKKYFRGIASEDGLRLTQRVTEGVFGKTSLQQIQEIYRDCCRLSGPEDEVWLFGFSRGAYVVRAVAGLLHYMRALTSADKSDKAFEKDYKEALKVYRTMQRQDRLRHGPGQIHEMFASTTRPAPTIKFVGVFDTVKAVNDQNLFDISLNDSIEHLRHALALNENREAMRPELIYPNFNRTRTTLLRRTFVQAWFVGAHIDLGGSSEKDGLSLYPLQWMLIESRDRGLCLGFDGTFGDRAAMDDPLRIVRLHGSTQEEWNCTTENGLTLKMVDMRQNHSESSAKRYQIQINRARGSLWKRKLRNPFDETGDLEGYCSFAPQGTIMHASVFLILDEQLGTSLDMQKFPFYTHLERWRYKTLGRNEHLPNNGFWNDRDLVDPENPGALRILVCGNCGVGKSTLINKVFGVAAADEVTQSSHRVKGVHNVKEEIKWAGRPDLIIHDSGGFEAAGVEEFEAIDEFLKDKWAEVEVDKRLHAIWYCIETRDPRPIQTATERLFRTISQYAQDVPVLLIATKKDEFKGIKSHEGREILESRREKVTLEAMDDYAEDQLLARLSQLQGEIMSVEGGRFDACVAVSKNDDKSIKFLSQTTAECFSHDRVRLLYIRAQVARIDLKIDLAMAKTIRIYRRVLASSVSLTAVPLASSTNRMSAAIKISKTIINCFGMPSINADTAFAICKANIWDDLGNNIVVLLAEAAAAMGCIMTVLAGGLPFFLIPMAANVPLVVPAAARLMLMLACDLILIFTRAFREASSKCITQPLVADLEKATNTYRAYCKEVHMRVSALAPRNSVFRCFQFSNIELGINEIIKDFKKRVVEDIKESAPSFRDSSSPSRPMSTITLSSSADTVTEDAQDIKNTWESLESQKIGIRSGSSAPAAER